MSASLATRLLIAATAALLLWLRVGLSLVSGNTTPAMAADDLLHARDASALQWLRLGAQTAPDPKSLRRARHLQADPDTSLCVEQLLAKLDAGLETPLSACPVPERDAQPRTGRSLIVVQGGPRALHQLDAWLGRPDVAVAVVLPPQRFAGFALPAAALREAVWVHRASSSGKWSMLQEALAAQLWADEFDVVWAPDAAVAMHGDAVAAMLAAAADAPLGYAPRVDELASEADVAEDMSSGIINATGGVMRWSRTVSLAAPWFRRDALRLLLPFLAAENLHARACGAERGWPTRLRALYRDVDSASDAPVVAVAEATPYALVSRAAAELSREACEERADGTSVLLSDANTRDAAADSVAAARAAASWCSPPPALDSDLTEDEHAALSPAPPLDPLRAPRWLDPAALRSVRGQTLVIAVVGSGDEGDAEVALGDWSGFAAFELCVVYTGASLRAFQRLQDLAAPGLAFSKRGAKFALAQWALGRVPRWQTRFEFVWFPEEGVRLSPFDLQRLVNVAGRMDLRLAHPALDNGEDDAMEARVKGLALREVNQVPMTAPLVRVDALAYVLPAVFGNGEYLQVLWPQLLRMPRAGIVDMAPYRLEHRQQGQQQQKKKQQLAQRETPAAVWSLGCAPALPMVWGEAVSEYQFHQRVRRSGDKDWCTLDAWWRWDREMRMLSTDLEPERSATTSADGQAFETGAVRRLALEEEQWEAAVMQYLRVDPTVPPLWLGPRRLEKLRGRNLVIVVAGDGSMHRNWAGHRDYDLCVVYFGNDRAVFEQYRAESEFAFQRKGMKWQLIRYALNRVKWRAQYQYVWLPDDDIDMHADAVAKMFEVADLYDVRVGQPALHDFGVHYPDHVVREDLALHFVNFIEIMVPFLRVDALHYLFPLWDEDRVHTGFGLDSLWPQLTRMKNLAVIDATPCNHTGGKIVGGRAGSFYSRLKVDPLVELQITILPYDCFVLWNVTETTRTVSVAEHNIAFPTLRLADAHAPIPPPQHVPIPEQEVVHFQELRPQSFKQYGLKPLVPDGLRERTPAVRLPTVHAAPQAEEEEV